MRRSLFLAITTLCTLSACSSPDVLSPDPIAGPAIPQELSEAALGSARYTLIDPSVRRALTEAGQDFTVRVHDGSYNFPSSALVGHYDAVFVDTNNITYGDLTGDGVPDAVVRVIAGTDEFASTELAALTASGGLAYQFAAFPLGRSVVRSVDITEGKIRVNFTHTVTGDPGPRNTELLLELPKK